ncbi:hypothetical protein QO004_005759 [Rhizobium mesoamericanum]|nr:hypothetical protein [Rhizobium mesoamericanum]
MNKRPSRDGLFFMCIRLYGVGIASGTFASLRPPPDQLAARISVSGFTFWFILKRFCGS